MSVLAGRLWLLPIVAIPLADLATVAVATVAVVVAVAAVDVEGVAAVLEFASRSRWDRKRREPIISGFIEAAAGVCFAGG